MTVKSLHSQCTVTVLSVRISVHVYTGLLERPLPPTLKAACDGKISDAGSIASSVTRGKEMVKKKTGSPVKSMD